MSQSEIENELNKNLPRLASMIKTNLHMLDAACIIGLKACARHSENFYRVKFILEDMILHLETQVTELKKNLEENT